MSSVALRPLVRADFPLLARWLREPLVAEWWHEDASGDALERRYGPAIDGTDPAECRIATSGGRPVGFIQWYLLADEAEYLAELRPWLPVSQDAWSLDYLLGAARFRGSGTATAMLQAALAEIGPAPVVVPVHERNTASARLLRRNGFVLAATADLDPDNPAHTRRHHVFRRPASSPGTG